MCKHSIIISALILFFSCNYNNKSEKSIAPPLVDGNIDDFVALKVRPIKLSEGVELYIYQNPHYVWFGYTYPIGSYGLMDMEITTPKLKDTLMLHVSAQLGEWPKNRPDLIPKSPESELWWNMNGWIANEVWLNGMDKSGSTTKYRFKNGAARELQLSKTRFGKGKWRFRLGITNIKGINGEDYSLMFPMDSTFHKITVP